jgi:hypothetical protein
MGRKRRRDKHLPTSVYHRHGAYYFVDKDGKWNRLGRSLGEAYRELAHFVEAPSVKSSHRTQRKSRRIEQRTLRGYKRYSAK